MALISENLYSMISMHPYQYSYFNPLFGGIKKAYGNFETDYWMLSVKEASNWLINHERIDKIKNKKSNITTNCMYPAQVFLNDTNSIALSYSRYYDRNEKNWDYAISVSYTHLDVYKRQTEPIVNVFHLTQSCYGPTFFYFFPMGLM